MEKIKIDMERIKKLDGIKSPTLEKIIENLKQIIKGRRCIMYSDIINYITRKGYYGKEFNDILIWCNYKIRYGDIYLPEQ